MGNRESKSAIVLRRALLSAPLVFALSAGAWGAVRSSGTVELSDDLAAGFAGSVGLSAPGLELSGSLGQLAASTASAPGTGAESGYFSRLVSTPAALGVAAVYSASTSLSGLGGIPNPSGTLYELQTSTASDFTGDLIYVSSSGWPVPLTGLRGNTAYHTRLRASYMGEDHTDYTGGVASYLTQPATPTPHGFTAVFSSSLTVAWSETSNAPGTQYFVQLGGEPGFLTGGFANTTASSHTFASLSPNTTYFIRLKAIGDAADETAYVLFGSTITAAVTPSTAAAPSVSSVTLTAYWGANGNPAGTRYVLAYSTDSFATVQGSSQTTLTYASFSGLTPNVTHYLRVSALNAAGTPGLPAELVSTMTAAAQPLKQADTFPSRGAFSASVQWLANGNPANTEYLLEASTAPGFGGAFTAGPGWAQGVAVTATGLEPLTLYYFRAKARNALGAESAWEDLGSTSTLAGVDTSSPVITNNQAGDMNWRSSNTAVYNVDLADSGGSYLDRLQVRVTSGPAGTGELAFDWSDTVTNINVNSYTANWSLTGAQWALLPAGTSYASVRAWDGIGNHTDYADAFYILKDTVAPSITDNQAGETTWRKADPGAIYEVDFADLGGSGLAAVEYSASNAAGSGNANVLAWTALAGLTPGATFYDGPWALNFNGLPSGATSYVSVRARDGAGAVTTLTDAFLVLKNVSGPTVKFTLPYAGFHSALAEIRGTAAPVLEYAISGTELTLQDKGSNNYWDGAAFISASPVWLPVTGTSNWTWSSTGVPWVSGTTYQAVARSSDTALNFSLPYATATFTFDTSVPTAFVSTPAANTTLETPVLVSGTAADSGPNAGVPYVVLTLRRAIDQKWWNFFTGTWGSTAVSTVTAGGGTWNFYADGPLRGNLQHGGTYYVYAAARDGAIPANESPAGLYATTFTVTDTAAPGSIAVSSAAMGTLPGRLWASWTSPGDDGDMGTLGDNCWFAINYSTWSGAEFSTTAALNQVAISTSGAAAGSTQYHLISGLTPGVTYFLKVWARDEAGNWSPASPLASGRAAPSLADSIAGNVKTPSGQGVTGVMVQAIDANLAVVKVAYTVDDGSGSFTLAGLGEGLYRVQATWIDAGFASSVASDQIPTGWAEALFTLSVDYQLASVGGELAGYRLSGGARPAGVLSAFVELYQGSRMVAVAPVGAGGRFLISGLLPGQYSLKVPDGAGGSKLLNIALAPGQDLRLSPLGALLTGAEVFAYPNPARRVVTFRVKSERSPVQKQVSVFDLTGRRVKEFSDADFRDCALASCASGRTDGFEAEWRLPAGVASGVYLYTSRVKETATGETESVTKKFAVVR